MALSGSIFTAVFIALVSYYYPQLVEPEYKPSSIQEDKVENSYDFIIVGAGSAGAVLARRLSEVKSWKVLLLEAGGDETPFSQTPLLHMEQRRNALDWNYTTVKQAKACLVTDGMCEYPRGRVMGGSSSINAMMYVRGNKQDYDGWKKLGLKDWSYDKVLPYFLRSEDMKEKDLAKTRYHAQGGPLTVQYPRYNAKITEDIIKAGVEIGMINRDYNGKEQSGISLQQVTIDGAQRCSTSSGFLLPIRGRPNLSILKNAVVSKILMDSEKHTATGVEFLKNGKKQTVLARKEVILSAGAIDSPKLLMLSGIGPKDHLKELGIQMIKDLPVGKNLQDHTRVTIPFKLNGIVTISPDMYLSAEAVLEYSQNKTGPLSTNGLTALAFFNLGRKIMTDPPDVQFLINSLQYPRLSPNESTVTIAISLLRPESVGTVKLSSAQPSDPPLIDPNYLSKKGDVMNNMAGMRVALKMMETKVLHRYSPRVYREKLPSCNHLFHNKTAFLDCVLAYYSETIYHPVGTAKMGLSTDPTAVVSPELRVHGINNLRVVDASVIPTMVSANTNAPVIMVAEKASDIIKESYKVS